MSHSLKNWLIRNRFQLVFLTIIVIAIYQCIYYFQLNKIDQYVNAKEKTEIDDTLEISQKFHRIQDQPQRGHNPNIFICAGNGKTISSDKVNDDYCDCDDGSDEPKTNACANGRFICESQRIIAGFKRIIPSGWVNDGICDCCDGSDEWKHKHIIKSLINPIQKRNHRFVAPCPKMCR